RSDGGEAGRPDGIADRRLQERIRAGGPDIVEGRATRFDPFRPVDRAELLLYLRPHAVALRVFEIAELDRKLGAAGDDVDRARLRLHEADRADLATGLG